MKSPKLVKNDNNQSEFQKSLEKNRQLDRVMELLLDTTENLDRLNFFISILAPWNDYPSENRQNTVIARYTKTTPQTVWNWRAGVTSCAAALGRLYGFARARFPNEFEMVVAFGEYIGRDFIDESGVDPEALK